MGLVSIAALPASTEVLFHYRLSPSLLLLLLLLQEVSCVGLVSVTALPAGTEVLFNYRLSPSLLGRPRWYVPVDSREENMRWA